MVTGTVGSAPTGEGDLLERLAAEGSEGLLHRAAAAQPVQVGGDGVLRLRPDDQALEAALDQPVTAALQQLLAHAEPLEHRRDVELVDLALIGSARA